MDSTGMDSAGMGVPAPGPRPPSGWSASGKAGSSVCAGAFRPRPGESDVRQFIDTLRALPPDRWTALVTCFEAAAG